MFFHYVIQGLGFCAVVPLFWSGKLFRFQFSLFCYDNEVVKLIPRKPYLFGFPKRANSCPKSGQRPDLALSLVHADCLVPSHISTLSILVKLSTHYSYDFNALIALEQRSISR